LNVFFTSVRHSMCYASTSSRGKKNGLGNRAEKSVAVDYSGIVVMLQFSGGLAQW